MTIVCILLLIFCQFVYNVSIDENEANCKCINKCNSCLSFRKYCAVQNKRCYYDTSSTLPCLPNDGGIQVEYSHIFGYWKYCSNFKNVPLYHKKIGINEPDFVNIVKQHNNDDAVRLFTYIGNRLIYNIHASHNRAIRCFITSTYDVEGFNDTIVMSNKCKPITLDCGKTDFRIKNILIKWKDSMEIVIDVLL